MNKIKLCATGALVAVALSSCHIYKKIRASSERERHSRRLREGRRSTGRHHLPSPIWDGSRCSAIRNCRASSVSALANNKDLKNAKLNVDIAHAQLKGAKLSYFPSLAFTPNGGSASYGGSHMNWSYTPPARRSMGN